MIRPSASWCIGRCRRDELCDPGLCAEKGLLIRRALDLMSALKLAVHIGLDEIRGDEFCAMLIIAEERDLLEREELPGLGPRAIR